MDSVKMYSSQVESNANIKLIHSMLELIYEIVQVVKLNDENYEQIDQFLESFTKNKISSKYCLNKMMPFKDFEMFDHILKWDQQFYEK